MEPIISNQHSNDYNEFRASKLKVTSPRQTKTTKTLYSKYIIRSIKKEHPYITISEDTYSMILKRINELLLEELFKGVPIKFPYEMGEVIITVHEGKIYQNKEGELVRTMPVDWDKTLHLWHTNTKAETNKVLVRDLPKNIYRIRYIKGKVGYKNRKYYTFKPCRSAKLKLKELINLNKGVPAYEYGIHIH